MSSSTPSKPSSNGSPDQLPAPRFRPEAGHLLGQATTVRMGYQRHRADMRISYRRRNGRGSRTGRGPGRRPSSALMPSPIAVTHSPRSPQFASTSQQVPDDGCAIRRRAAALNNHRVVILGVVSRSLRWASTFGASVAFRASWQHHAARCAHSSYAPRVGDRPPLRSSSIPTLPPTRCAPAGSTSLSCPGRAARTRRQAALCLGSGPRPSPAGVRAGALTTARCP